MFGQTALNEVHSRTDLPDQYARPNMHDCNLGTVEPPGSELSPIDWGFDSVSISHEGREGGGELVLGSL